MVGLTMFFNHFGPFWPSRKPGRYLESIPVPLRFIYTEYQPVASHEHPNCYDFHDFSFDFWRILAWFLARKIAFWQRKSFFFRVTVKKIVFWADFFNRLWKPCFEASLKRPTIFLTVFTHYWIRKYCIKKKKKNFLGWAKILRTWTLFGCRRSRF